MMLITCSCVGCLCYQNQLGILWAGRDETETAQGFLETAEAIYQRYMKEVRLCDCLLDAVSVLTVAEEKHHAT